MRIEEGAHRHRISRRHHRRVAILRGGIKEDVISRRAVRRRRLLGERMGRNKCGRGKRGSQEMLHVSYPHARGKPKGGAAREGSFRRDAARTLSYVVPAIRT